MTTTKKKNYWRYLIYVVLLGLVIWPTSRSFFQQQLMRIGLFQPNLENKESQSGTDSVQRVSFISMDKEIVNTADMLGKVVFINFWATWCGPCITEMPSIQKLYDKFKDNPQVVFLIVEVDSNTRGARQFLTENKLTLPIFFPNSNIPQAWLSSSIPSTVILNKKGVLVEKKVGMYDYSGQKVQDYIQSLINQN